MRCGHAEGSCLKQLHWHAQKIRCTTALVVRGYREGSYKQQSPYSVLMLVLGHRGKYQIQGMLADSPLKKRDLIRLSKLGARKGVHLITTRRHGNQVVIVPKGGKL
jgi:hypothetical protein